MIVKYVAKRVEHEARQLQEGDPMETLRWLDLPGSQAMAVSEWGRPDRVHHLTIRQPGRMQRNAYPGDWLLKMPGGLVQVYATDLFWAIYEMVDG